ncbi:sugar transferase [Halpernia sp. GG3]
MLIKRFFDIVFSLVGLFLLSPIILVLILISAINTSSKGIFQQIRIGQFGELFTIYKLQSIDSKSYKVSKIGSFLKKSKLDELPQLLNILSGKMSFVGPRPDISGYYDKLEGENRKILNLKPGLTSEASLKYAEEEEFLAKQENPLVYNDTVIFPDKVKMNLDYYYKRTLWLDIKIIFKTIFREYFF